MAKKKIRVLDAVVDGKGRGEEMEVDAKTADMLIRNGYAEIVEGKKKDDKDEDK